MVEVGNEAPDFELKDHLKNPVRLRDFRGAAKVLLVFYPAAFSSTCTGEFCELRDRNADLIGEDTVVLGISTDPPHALRVWREIEGFPNVFLSDFWPHGEVSRLYGAFDERIGQATRYTFLIDRQGIVRYAERNPLERLGEARDQAAWRAALDALG